MKHKIEIAPNLAIYIDGERVIGSKPHGLFLTTEMIVSDEDLKRLADRCLEVIPDRKTEKMANDLIRKSDVLETYADLYDIFDDNKAIQEELHKVFDKINDISAVEPKRGEWKPFDLTWGRRIWYCTACEESTEVPCDIWEHKPIYKYCPNCGADMRKESE